MPIRIFYPTLMFRICLLALSFLLLTACAVTEKDHSSSGNPAYVTPFTSEYGVAVFVDELDGSPVSYSELNRIALDSGKHEFGVRLEYQPATGSSLVVGGLGSLLLRAGTNQTYHHTFGVELEAGHNYGLTVKGTDVGFELLVFDETAAGAVVLEHQFQSTDGSFERIF